MKTLVIRLAVVFALFLACSTASAAVVRVGIGPVRVGIRTPVVRPVRPAYVAPRPVVAVPTRAAVRATVHARRTAFWDAIQAAQP